MTHRPSLAPLLLSLTVACGTSSRQSRITPPTTARVAAPTTTATPAATPAPEPPSVSAQVPHDYAVPAVVRTDAQETLLLAGNVRAVVHADGRVEMARALTERGLVWAQQRSDGRWYFATRDGVVLTAAHFTAPFDTSGTLPAAPMGLDASAGFGRVGAITMRQQSGAWLRIDDPAHPTAIESDLADIATDLRFVNAQRALAIVSPNLVYVSNDAGETWDALAMQGDTPLHFTADDRGDTVVVGARHRWRLADDGASLARVDGPDTARSADAALARWSAWWREHLWPTGSTLFFDTEHRRAQEHRDALVTTNDHAFIVLRRDGTLHEVEVPGAPLGLCAMRPFGDTMLADCHDDHDDVEAPTRLLTLDLNTLAVRDLAVPPTSSYFAAAPDGSLLIEKIASQSEALAWTPGHPWQRVTFEGYYTLAHDVARGTAVALPRQGPLQLLSFQRDGAPTRSALAATERARGTLLRVRGHDGLWTSLWRDAAHHRCELVLEGDGHPADVLALDACDDPEDAVFMDARVGVVVTRTKVLSTHDGGAHWDTQDRVFGDAEMRSLRSSLSSLPSVEVVGLGLLVGGAHLVPRDALATATVWRRPPVERDDGPRTAEDSLPFTLLRCRRMAPTPAAVPAAGTTVLLHHGARVEVRATQAGDAVLADVRWRGDLPGVAGSFRGPAPWPEASLDVTDGARVVYATRGASPAGVLVERCLLDASQPRESGATTRCSVHWFHRAGVTELTFQQLPRPEAGALVELAAPDGDGWVVELSPGDARAEGTWSQWQHWGADHQLARWGDVRRRHPSEPYAALARFDGHWGAIVGDMERRALRFVPHEAGVDEGDMNRPESIAVCTARVAPTADLWIDSGGLGIGLYVNNLEASSSALLDWSWRLALTDNGWCAAEAHTALSAHEWAGRAGDRADVAWSVRMGDALAWERIPMGIRYTAPGAITERNASASVRDRVQRMRCSPVELGDPLFNDYH